MKENLKRKIILFLILTTVVVGALDVSYGVFFGVLTNLLINAFWNSKLFPKIEKSNEQLIVESVQRPKL
jgi:MFS superfamily sulfate permease-like transporter